MQAAQFNVANPWSLYFFVVFRRRLVVFVMPPLKFLLSGIAQHS